MFKLCPGLRSWQLDDAWAGLAHTTWAGLASRRLQSTIDGVVSLSILSARAGLETHKVVEPLGLRRLLEERHFTLLLLLLNC